MPNTLFTGTHLLVLERDHWQYAERRKGKSAAVIFALTDDDRVVLTEQFRKPVNARVIDFPAGLVGDESEDEDAAVTARRELEEETGFVCESLEAVGSGPSSPGITSEIIHMFRATGLRRDGQGGGVEGEEIEVHQVPRADLEHWLQRKRGEGVLIDVKVWAGLYFLSTST
ncbi:MAG TPA: NUDIX hydrolase [Thermoanaerobaculia bacterium]|nr:NUDIX hydrolase [Thermoanaerobaculia bacterium]